MKILITGANGLVGRALCSVLNPFVHNVVRAVRTSMMPWEVSIGDLNKDTDWSKALGQGTDVVIHLAGQVPLTDSASMASGDRYTEVNALGTANLARQCALYGVKRFIFISTIKVLGDGKSKPYRDTDLAVPADAYAISKWEAEQMLWQIAAEMGMEVVVLRPPLVYGAGVKGNFLRLMQAIDKRRPLPLGGIHNRRSLIYLGNLVDAICLCLTHPKAAGKTFLVGDGDDVSTPELVRQVAAALGRRPFLLPVPESWMRWAGRMLGKQASVDRLLGSLCVDITPLREELGWNPPYTMQVGLEATVRWYRQTKVTV
ncbi:UDP-glucose 4-epimerase family protein [Laribacter hongkongensis]|uniref:UDP-glucose 4-epimerase family protein n=1 Tax=Laribacter hongkongensis TaxID=168471 RepID=UPI001EFD6856|nr:SDR family oxidoreductase [Laribacter hongkongensis]MCG9098022.1 SDR family oxidoreductase [Laribacter hongkongensis]